MTRGGLAYVWVPQWHPGGHGLHAHFAVGRFVPRTLIERSWGNGFVHIKLLDGLPVGSGRRWRSLGFAARYLARYVGREVEDERPAFRVASVRGCAGFPAGEDRVLRRVSRGRDRPRVKLSRLGPGVMCGCRRRVEGWAWAARLLGAVELTEI